jgi:hypothetical protein
VTISAGCTGNWDKNSRYAGRFENSASGFRTEIYSSGIPTVGIFQIGDEAFNTAAPSTTSIEKWERLTAGSSHVLGTDWLAVPLLPVLAGSGSPEGAVAAPVGSIYKRTDGAAGTVLYVKESGAGNTGWVPYGAGPGGQVTQATSKATGVTLNKARGEITLNNAALAANTVVSFTLTNSVIGANDTLTIHRKSGGTAAAYRVWIDSVAAGSCVVCVENRTAGSLSEAPLLQFEVRPGAIA